MKPSRHLAASKQSGKFLRPITCFACKADLLAAATTSHGRRGGEGLLGFRETRISSVPWHLPRMQSGLARGCDYHSSDCPSRSARAVFLHMLAFPYPQACLNLTSPPLLVFLKNPYQYQRIPHFGRFLSLLKRVYSCV